MSVIEELNLKYKKLFSKEKTRLMLKWDPIKLEILEKLEFVDINWDGEPYIYILTFVVDGEKQNFNNGLTFFTVSVKNQSVTFPFEEFCILENWWSEMGIEECIKRKKKEVENK